MPGCVREARDFFINSCSALSLASISDNSIDRSDMLVSTQSGKQWEGWDEHSPHNASMHDSDPGPLRPQTTIYPLHVHIETVPKAFLLATLRVVPGVPLRAGD